MLSTQLMKLAERNQWKIHPEEKTAFGDFNGYLFTVFEGKSFKGFITPVAGISQEGLKALTRFIDDNFRILNLRNYEINDNFLCLRQNEGLIPVSVDKMEYLLAQISGLLNLYELPDCACVICGQPAQRKGLYFGLFCHLHPECEDREMTDFTMTLQEEADSDIDSGEEKKADSEE